jgi:hypothetical protein
LNWKKVKTMKSINGNSAMQETAEATGARIVGYCPRCRQNWNCPDGHGECFDWTAIEATERQFAETMNA